MSTHITQIGKHKFICGLFWQSLSRPRDLWKEAAELGKKIDSDLMVLRKDQSTAQAGFAHTRDGARKQAFSLGAAVSKTLAVEGAVYDGQKQPVHNWLGAFKLADGMWAYFAVRDANFLPNGDFAGTKEEVLERLHGDYGLGGWNVVIGDAELENQGFHNFTAKQIQDLIPHDKNGEVRVHRWWALRPVEKVVPWKSLALGAAILAILGIAGFVFIKTKQKQQEEQQRNQAIEAARQKMLGNAPPSPLPHPWPNKPQPVHLAQACVDKFTFLAPGGWLLEEYNCTANNINYIWSRQGSTLEMLLDQVPGAQVEITGDRATYSEMLKLPVGRNEDLISYKDLLAPFLSKLQILGLTAKIARIAETMPPTSSVMPNFPAQKPPQPDWQTYSLSLNTISLSPLVIAELLSFPGIRIDRLIYKSGSWSIEGVIYAR